MEIGLLDSDGSGPKNTGPGRAQALKVGLGPGPGLSPFISAGPSNFTVYSSKKAQIFRPFPKSQTPGLLGLGPFSKSRAPGLPKNTGLGPGPGRAQARTHH